MQKFSKRMQLHLNQFGAMERETIQKNRVSLKNGRRKVNFLMESNL